MERGFSSFTRKGGYFSHGSRGAEHLLSHCPQTFLFSSSGAISPFDFASCWFCRGLLRLTQVYCLWLWAMVIPWKHMAFFLASFPHPSSKSSTSLGPRSGCFLGKWNSHFSPCCSSQGIVIGVCEEWDTYFWAFNFSGVWETLTVQQWIEINKTIQDYPPPRFSTLSS